MSPVVTLASAPLILSYSVGSRECFPSTFSPRIAAGPMAEPFSIVTE